MRRPYPSSVSLMMSHISMFSPQSSDCKSPLVARSVIRGDHCHLDLATGTLCKKKTNFNLLSVFARKLKLRIERKKITHNQKLKTNSNTINTNMYVSHDHLGLSWRSQSAQGFLYGKCISFSLFI